MQLSDLLEKEGGEELVFQAINLWKIFGQRGTQAEDKFEKKQLMQMRESHYMLHRIDVQGISDPAYWQKSKFTDIRFSSAHEAERAGNPLLRQMNFSRLIGPVFHRSSAKSTVTGR